MPLLCVYGLVVINLFEVIVPVEILKKLCLTYWLVNLSCILLTFSGEATLWTWYRNQVLMKHVRSSVDLHALHTVSGLWKHHHSDVTWVLRCVGSQALLWFQFVHVNSKENIKAVHYWSFVREIHQWLMHSPHRGPMIEKGIPCHDMNVVDWRKLIWYRSLLLLTFTKIGVFWQKFQLILIVKWHQ